MTTIEEVNKQALRIKKLIKKDKNITLRMVYKHLAESGEPVLPEHFLSVYFVGTGRAIPEIVIEARYPSVEYIRFLDIESQKKHIRDRKPFELVVTDADGGFLTENRNFKELSHEECEQLFACQNSIMLGRSLVRQLRSNRDEAA
ncbi:MAG: hypothetical protein EOP09_15865 [Proteobacteria bacterium]|nr:MAG: hypothetical protein EOP09_15865 [Pseudomonadota bacterium]